MNTDTYKQKLEAEKAQLEQELKSIGIETDAESGDWIPRASELAVDQADTNEVADSMEDAGEHLALLNDLEPRYKNILHALKKIKDGTFGKDELDGEPIEEDRLEANPAARTRKANIEREEELTEL